MFHWLMKGHCFITTKYDQQCLPPAVYKSDSQSVASRQQAINGTFEKLLQAAEVIFK